MHFKPSLLIFPFVFFLSACSDNSSSGDPAPIASVGVFIDSPVSGLSYSAPTFTGLTNDKGEFKYLPGESVTFLVGDIVLGSEKGAPIITPLSLVPDATNAFDTKVTNIVRLLMTLDDDGDASNGIRIPSAISDAAKGESINLTAPDLAVDPGLIKFLDKLLVNLVLVESSTAQSHFSQTLSEQSTWGALLWGSSRWQGMSHWGSMSWGSDKWQKVNTDL